METPYELKLEQRDGYLYALVNATAMDRDIAMAYLSEIAAECDRLNCEGVLIERNVPVMLPDADLFFVTNAFLEMIDGRRVAFVNPHEPIEQDMAFAVTIGTNRGANYKLFDDVESAEQWLTQ
jgi:hypothetical protein